MQQTGTRFCFQCGFVSTDGHEVCPDDGSPMSLAGVDPYIGKTLIGKYEVLELLGRGGMSVVYKVRPLFINRLEALKMMRTEMASDSDALRRFQQEATAVAALRHVNIVTVLDFGLLEDGNPYLTMEFLEGTDFGDLIDKEKYLVPERAIPIFAQICAGLHHAHSRGVIHRDLKPSNILITTANGVDLPIIVDFGIAKLVNSDGSAVNKLTTTGQVFGSPLYMSPEQCNSQPVDERTDVYALGCVFYHALTGSPPIQGNAPLETMMRHMMDKAPPFCAKRPDHTIDPEIESVILKALAKNPDDRHASMNDFRQALLKAANMTITDLNSGSYIQSSGITPGIGITSGINKSLSPEQTFGNQNTAGLSVSSSQSLEPRLTYDSSGQNQTDDYQSLSSRQRRLYAADPASPTDKIRSTSDSTYVVEPSYQGLFRRPIVQISVSLVVFLFVALFCTLAINSGHQRSADRDGNVEQTFGGQTNTRSHPNERPGYAEDNVATKPSPDLIASMQASAPGSPPVPGVSSGFSSQTPMKMKTRANSPARFSRSSGPNNASQVFFNQGPLPDSWKYDYSLIDELSSVAPGTTQGNGGTVYLITFSGPGSNADLAAIADSAAAKLGKKIAIKAAPKSLIAGSSPVYLQEIKYAGKQRSSFVVYYCGEHVTALHVVPQKVDNQATREFVEKEIIPKLSFFKKL